jgi:hypothetical protein
VPARARLISTSGVPSAGPAVTAAHLRRSVPGPSMIGRPARGAFSHTGGRINRTSMTYCNLRRAHTVADGPRSRLPVFPDTPPGIREAAGIPVARPARSRPPLPLALHACRPLCRPAYPGPGMRHACKAAGHERKRDVATGEPGQAGRHGPGRRDPVTPDNPHSARNAALAFRHDYLSSTVSSAE